MRFSDGALRWPAGLSPGRHRVFLLENLTSTLALSMLAGMLKAANDNRYIPPPTPEQLAEIDRRAAALDSGEMMCEPWEIVMQRILGNLPRR